MRGWPTSQAIRLRLLALVLALALTWYAMNPAPGPVRRVKRDEEQPDEERREADSPQGIGHWSAQTAFDAPRTVPAPAEPGLRDVDELEWPDVINLR